MNNILWMRILNIVIMFRIVKMTLKLINLVNNCEKDECCVMNIVVQRENESSG